MWEGSLKRIHLCSVNAGAWLIQFKVICPLNYSKKSITSLSLWLITFWRTTHINQSFCKCASVSHLTNFPLQYFGEMFWNQLRDGSNLQTGFVLLMVYWHRKNKLHLKCRCEVLCFVVSMWNHCEPTEDRRLCEQIESASPVTPLTPNSPTPIYKIIKKQ